MTRVVVLLAAVVASACAVVTPPPGPESGPAVGEEAFPPGAAEPTAPAGADPGAWPGPREVGFEPGPVRRFAEVRGLWVVRTTLTTPEGIRTLVARAAAAGFNTLLVQVRGRADAFYDSRWEPPGELLAGSPPGFDPLAMVIEEAHARGLAVHAWVNTHLVWSGETLPTSPHHIVNARPDWLAVPVGLGRALHDVDPLDPAFVTALRRYAWDNPDRVEGVYTSPSHPAVRGRLVDVWLDLAERYDLDGIHFDYVRFPSRDFDYSRGALERFRRWVLPRLSPDRRTVLRAAAAADPYAYAEALPGPWGEFRRAQITELVSAVYHGVKARRPDLQISAAVFPNGEDAFGNRFQDWPDWLDRGIVDVVVPMAYTSDRDTFVGQVRYAKGAAGTRERVWAGVGVHLNGLDGVVQQIDEARREEVGGVVLFSYDWIVQQAPGPGSISLLEQVGRARFAR